MHFSIMKCILPGSDQDVPACRDDASNPSFFHDIIFLEFSARAPEWRSQSFFFIYRHFRFIFTLLQSDSKVWLAAAIASVRASRCLARKNRYTLSEICSISFATKCSFEIHISHNPNTTICLDDNGFFQGLFSDTAASFSFIFLLFRQAHISIFTYFQRV